MWTIGAFPDARGEPSGSNQGDPRSTPRGDTAMMGDMSQHAEPTRVFRSRQDRVLGGVAGGFGRYFSIDPAVVRLLFVALAFAGGLGVLLYLAAWAIVPDEPATGAAPPTAPAARPRSTAAWTVVIVVAAVLLLAGVGRAGRGLEPGILWPLALIGFGIAVLWLRANDSAAPAPAPPAPQTTTASVAATHVPAHAEHVPTPDPTAPSAPWVVAPITESPLRRAVPVLARILVVAVCALVALVVTALAVLAIEGPGSINVTPLEAAITGIAIVIVAVAVGIRCRRVADLLVVAVAIVAVLAVAGWIGPPFRGGFGTRDIRPASAASVSREYHLAGGRLTIDLGSIDLATRSRPATATLAAGRLFIVVPDQATVVLDAHVDAGQVVVFGQRRDTGVGVSLHTVERAGAGTLRIRARVGFGEVVVERVSADRAQSARGRGAWLTTSGRKAA
jgi:phage shock protein PspC (stress-responsive transcriptional regulator)